MVRWEQVSTRSKEQLTKRWSFVISEWVEVTALMVTCQVSWWMFALAGQPGTCM